MRLSNANDRYNRSMGGGSFRLVPSPKGGGAIQDISTIIRSINPSVQKYPGEKHLVYSDGRVSNFTGPGTRIDLRKNDQPINKLDAAAKEHDLAYADLSKKRKAGNISKDEFISKIHQADTKFIDQAESLKDDDENAALAARMIKLKKKLEEMGVLPSSVFSGAGPAQALVAKQMLQEMDDEDEEEEGPYAEQSGGFIPIPIAAAIISTLGPPIVDFIYNKIKGQSGTGIRSNLSHEDKKNYILNAYKEEISEY